MRVSLGAARLDRASPIPLHQQLARHLRELIMCGALATGVRLAGSRTIAAEIGCSRFVVIEALDLLCAEGYLHVVPRSGLTVTLPRSSRLDTAGLMARTAPSPDGLRVSANWQSIIDDPYEQDPLSPFSSGAPEMRDFPRDAWARALRRSAAALSDEAMLAGSALGETALRQAVAAFLGSVRGLICQPEQIAATSGTTSALNLCARMLLDSGDEVWVEEPGFVEARWALMSVGARLVPVPVDESGLVVSEGLRRAPNARLAIVTPSHQYPLGVILSPARRLELLDWAERKGAWLIEDDYNSEFRRPDNMIASLKSLDSIGRVIYLGTFSKMMFPGIRLGYMVAERGLLDIFGRGRARVDPQHPPAVVQMAVAELMTSGLLLRHLRRMRPLYRERHDAAVGAFREAFGDDLLIAHNDVGLHFVSEFSVGSKRKLSDREAAVTSRNVSRFLQPLSQTYLTKPAKEGFVVGFGRLDPASSCRLAAALAAAIR